MQGPPFHDPGAFAFVPALEAAFPALRREADALERTWFVEAPDSLTLRRDGYDETGWRYLALVGPGADARAGEGVPETLAACARVPGLVNAGLSLFEPGTHLFPHRGELASVLRCHLPLRVPAGDVGLRVGGELRRWHEGRALVFDDAHEHTAWNHGEGPRLVLLVTFRPRRPEATE